MDENYKRIAIIGAGQIGSRHLQALAKIDVPVYLQVVDKNETSLGISEQRYLEVPSNPNIMRIDFLSDISELHKNIDLCIIATNADVRFVIMKDILRGNEIKNVILEKVTFQCKEQFEEIKSLLKEQNVHCWVNCPRRTYPIYKQIKKYFDKNEQVNCHISGGNWGLASNAIHFIDLMEYFVNESNYELDISRLDACLLPAKRSGFAEITGCLVAIFRNGNQLVMNSISGSHDPVIIELESSSCAVFVHEAAGIAKMVSSKRGAISETIDFTMPYQSNLTQDQAKEILEFGTSQLTDYGISSKLQMPFIEGIIKHIQLVSGNIVNKCPIT